MKRYGRTDSVEKLHEIGKNACAVKCEWRRVRPVDAIDVHLHALTKTKKLPTEVKPLVLEPLLRRISILILPT